jgi:hypothetical protein
MEAPPNEVAARAKTEMGAPLMGPPAAYGGAPAFGAGGGASGAVVPAAPGPSTGGKKGGPPPLVIGLGALAVLLFVGAGIGLAVGGKSKTAVTPPVDLGGTTATSATAPVASTDVPVETVTSAAPLDNAAAKIPPGGGAPAKGSSGKSVTPVPTPIPTPQPQKPEPEICKKLKTARDAHLPAAAIASLEKQCKAAGGNP